MTNKEIYDLTRKSKAIFSKVPETVKLAGKHKAETSGELHPFAKLTNAQVFQMKLLYLKYKSRVCDIARQYQISYSYAAKVVKGKVRCD